MYNGVCVYNMVRSLEQGKECKVNVGVVEQNRERGKVLSTLEVLNCPSFS